MGGGGAIVESTVATLEVQVTDLKFSADQFFLVLMGMFVFFMQCGFAFLECGAITSKNATNILIKNLMDSLIAALAYFFIGYPLAYGKGNDFFGMDYFAAWNFHPRQYSQWFFQYVFAAATATIVSGAVAERCKFSAYVSYSGILSGIAYPIVTHWCWSEYGWLKKAGFVDFAGSAVIHVQGGTAAFIGALFLGPREGRFDEDGNPRHIRGHSTPLTTLGGFILLFGFLGISAGSNQTISGAGDGTVVGRAVMNTLLSGSCSAIVTLLFARYRHDYWSLLMSLNSALAGMVAAAAGCNVYHPVVACLVGVGAAISYLFVTWFTLQLKVDDPLEAVGVHFGGGVWGILCQPVFRENHGMLYSWTPESIGALAINAGGACTIVIWSCLVSIAVFGILQKIDLLRVDAELEEKGMDEDEPAYPERAYGDGYSKKVGCPGGWIRQRKLQKKKQSVKH